MALSVEDLRAICTDSSLERGKKYFNEGRVRILARNGHSITAHVQGTSLYTVGIDLRDDLFAVCTCPYAHEGYCKHIVAVMIAVIAGAEDEGRREKSAAERVAARKQRQNAEPVPGFSEALRMMESADDEQLKQFLKKELKENPQLKAHLLLYFSRKRTA